MGRGTLVKDVLVTAWNVTRVTWYAVRVVCWEISVIGIIYDTLDHLINKGKVPKSPAS